MNIKKELTIKIAELQAQVDKMPPHDIWKNAKISFKYRDGSVLWVTSSDGKYMNEYLLPTPWAIETAEYVGTLDSDGVWCFCPKFSRNGILITYK